VSRICGCLGETLLLQAARAYREHAGQGTRREQQFRRIRRYILEHLDQPLTVTDVARQAGISRVYLHGLFRELAGEPPKSWILRHRMSLAEARLQTAGQTVQEVAYSLGLDPAAFSRAFKRVTGVSPSRILRR
jgi:AraC-like DNA-binding protein